MRPAPRLVLSESFLFRVQAALDLAQGREVAFALYGARRGDTLVLTHPLIFRQESGFAHYTMDSSSVSETGARAWKEIPHAIPLGYAHSHPGRAMPVPSSIDDRNRDLIAPLMMPFTWVEEAREVVLAGRSESGQARWTTEGGGIEIQGGPVEAPLQDLRVRTVSRNGYQVFLVFNSHGDADRIAAEIVEHVVPPAAALEPAFIHLHTAADLRVVPDAEAALLAGWTSAQIRCPHDYAGVQDEIRRQLPEPEPQRPETLGWDLGPRPGPSVSERHDDGGRSLSLPPRPQPAPVRESSGSQGFVYLTGRSDLADVAQVLDEAASVLRRRPHRGFEYLGTGARVDEVHAAVREALILLARHRVKSRNEGQDGGAR